MQVKQNLSDGISGREDLLEEREVKEKKKPTQTKTSPLTESWIS